MGGKVMSEVWKSVQGYECYEVSNLGNVRVSGYGQLNPRKSNSGYLHVGLKRGVVNKKTVSVHCLVLIAFKGPRPDGMVARHLDGNRLNNHADNLEGSTQSENLADRYLHGTDFRGEGHPNSKLTDSEIRVIRNLASLGISKVEISKIFSVTPSNIGQIVRRKSWTHVQ